MFHERYILDVAVYRESEKRFYDRLQDAIERRLKEVVDDQGIPRTRFPDLVMNISDRIRRHMHGPWNFNQVVGWIRVCLLGSSVRGELWWTTETHVRTRPTKRRFEDFGKAFELPLMGDETDTEIAMRVRNELARCLRGRPYRRGVWIDLEVFDNLAAALPWRRLLGFSEHSAT